MKKNLMALALATASCLSAGAYAADGANGTITFHGNVNGGTCTAPTDFANAKVPLGDVGLNEISASGVALRPWSKSFVFTSCPASLTKLTTKVTFRQYDSSYGYVKNSGTSNGIVMSLAHDDSNPKTRGYGIKTGYHWDTNVANGAATVKINGTQFLWSGQTAKAGTLDFPINLTVEYI